MVKLSSKQAESLILEGKSKIVSTEEINEHKRTGILKETFEISESEELHHIRFHQRDFFYKRDKPKIEIEKVRARKTKEEIFKRECDDKKEILQQFTENFMNRDIKPGNVTRNVFYPILTRRNPNFDEKGDKKETETLRNLFRSKIVPQLFVSFAMEISIIISIMIRASVRKFANRLPPTTVYESNGEIKKLEYGRITYDAQSGIRNLKNVKSEEIGKKAVARSIFAMLRSSSMDRSSDEMLKIYDFTTDIELINREWVIQFVERTIFGIISQTGQTGQKLEQNWTKTGQRTTGKKLDTYSLCVHLSEFCRKFEVRIAEKMKEVLDETIEEKQVENTVTDYDMVLDFARSMLAKDSWQPQVKDFSQVF